MLIILSYRVSIFVCNAVSLFVQISFNSAVNPIDIVSRERHVQCCCFGSVCLALGFGCNVTHRQTLPRGAELNWS